MLQVIVGMLKGTVSKGFAATIVSELNCPGGVRRRQYNVGGTLLLGDFEDVTVGEVRATLEKSEIKMKKDLSS